MRRYSLAILLSPTKSFAFVDVESPAASVNAPRAAATRKSILKLRATGFKRCQPKQAGTASSGFRLPSAEAGSIPAQSPLR